MEPLSDLALPPLLLLDPSGTPLEPLPLTVAICDYLLLVLDLLWLLPTGANLRLLRFLSLIDLRLISSETSPQSEASLAIRCSFSVLRLALFRMSVTLG